MLPTDDPLAGVRAKINRAKQRLADYQRVRDRFKEANKYLIDTKDQPETGQRAYYLTRDPDPTEFSLFVGDVVQNLRSALDHLAFALCVAGPGGLSDAIDAMQVIKFPITQGDSKAYLALKSRTEVVRLSKLGVERVLDGIEPYKGGKGEVLAQVSALNNADKHRLLVTVGLRKPRIDAAAHALETIKLNLPSLLEGLGDVTFEPVWLIDNTPEPLKTDDVLLFEPLNTKQHKHVQLEFEVALNEPQIVPLQAILPLLPDMVNYVESIVPAFEGFVL